jgi:hypothetical protein
MVTISLLVHGCGPAADDRGYFDDTCFDCRTVCDGTTGDTFDACLIACVDCQGYSHCFRDLEDRFDDLQLTFQEWTATECPSPRTYSRLEGERS